MAFSTSNIGKNCYINMSEDQNVEDSLYGTIIGYYKDTDKNEEYYFVSINGNVKRIYDDSLVNIIEDGGSVTPGTLIMVSGEMTEEQAGQFRENIGALSTDDIGTVFVLKGSVATVEDLPTTGNNIGDVYYVQDVSAGYIWLISDSHPNGYWEELGETFDVTVDSELSNTSENPVQNKVIKAALDGKGTYSKPSGGIPKSDLASAVQTSLGKADTALQAAPVTSVNGKTGAVTLTAADVGAAEAETIVTVSDVDAIITPAPNTIYNCGELASLTISNPPTTGAYSIVFTSGATATTTTFPATILGLEDFAAEANTIYEINVLDNRAVVGSWEVGV